MSLIWILIIGLLVGASAKFLMPRLAAADLMISMLLGVVGALVVACVGRAAGLYAETGPLGITGSVVGGMLIMPLSLQIKGRLR